MQWLVCTPNAYRYAATHMETRLSMLVTQKQPNMYLVDKGWDICTHVTLCKYTHCCVLQRQMCAKHDIVSHSFAHTNVDGWCGRVNTTRSVGRHTCNTLLQQHKTVQHSSTSNEVARHI